MKVVRNGQNNQDLNKQIESILQWFKADLVKLQSYIKKKKQKKTKTKQINHMIN